MGRENIALVVSAHGRAAAELIESAKLFVGDLKFAYPVDFLPGENTDTLVDKYKVILEKEKDKKILFLVDTWGGSPFNAANRIASNDPNIEIVSGLNIPMLIEVFMALDDDQTLLSLTQIALTAGSESIRALKNHPKPTSSPPTPPSPPQTVATSVPPVSSVEDEIEQAVGSDHMIVALARVDDRLIHGQVATVWAKETRIKRIIVVNDEIAKDKDRINLLKQVVPPGITGHVVSVAKASRVYNNTQYKGERVMMLFTVPGDVLKLVKAGFDIKSVNIGGMAFREGRSMVTKAISVSNEEAAHLRELDALGVDLDTRVVVNSERIDLIATMNSKNI